MLSNLPVFGANGNDNEACRSSSHAANRTQQSCHQKEEKSNVEFCGQDIPTYNAGIDYQFLYHKLFQENESKLQQYDRLLESRDKDLKAYMALKNGHFSDYIQIKLAAASSSNEAALDSLVSHLRPTAQTNQQISVLIPQLLAKRNSSVMCDDNLMACNQGDSTYHRGYKAQRIESESANQHFDLRGNHHRDQSSSSSGI